MATWFPCVCSLVSGGIAGFCVWKFFSLKEKIYQMKATETMTVKALQESAAEIAAEIGAGGFNQVCEVKGRLSAASPLQGDFSGQAAVMVVATITRRWEEDYEEYDEQLKRSVRRTRSGSEVVSSNRREAECEVDDGTGRLEVRLEGAEVDLIQSHSRFEPGDRPSIQIAGFNIGFNIGHGRRTLGYEYREEILPQGARVYILGEVRDSEGLAMRKPDDPKKRFFITTKSEEELLAATAKSKTFALVGAIVFAVLTLLFALGQVGALFMR